MILSEFLPLGCYDNVLCNYKDLLNAINLLAYISRGTHCIYLFNISAYIKPLQTMLQSNDQESFTATM